MHEFEESRTFKQHNMQSKILKNLFIKIYSVHQLISCSTYKKKHKCNINILHDFFSDKVAKNEIPTFLFPYYIKCKIKKNLKNALILPQKCFLNVNLWSWVHNVKFEMVLSPNTRNLASRSSCTWPRPLQMNLTSTSHTYTAPLTLNIYFTLKNKVSIVYN